MKVQIKNLQIQPNDFLRKAGYGQHRDRHASEASWTKRLTPEMYPRYHIYVDIIDDGFVIKLHLDQKKPSYQGTSAHAGEYEGPAVEREIKRLEDIAEKLRGEGMKQEKPKKQKGFFNSIFGR